MNLALINNKLVWISEKMLRTTFTLGKSLKGGFFHVEGYQPTTNWVKSPIQNIQGNTRFSLSNYYKRQLAILDELSFDDVEIKGAKLEALTKEKQENQFQDCVKKMKISLKKTLTGDRSDNHRKGHDTFYIHTEDGIKIHLETKKINDSTTLVLKDGHPIAKSIMVSYMETSVKTIVEGERNIVDNGVKVLMDKCIKKAMNMNLKYRTVSLKEDNFYELKMGGEMYTHEDI